MRSSKLTYLEILMPLLLVFFLFMSTVEITYVNIIKASVIPFAILIFANLLVREEFLHRKFLVIGIITIALGHRGLNLGYYSILTPLHITILLLALVLFFQKAINLNKINTSYPPLTLILFSLWLTFHGLVSLILYNISLDLIFAWIFPQVICIPVFLVVGNLITNKVHVDQILFGVYLGSIILAFLVIVDYFYHSIVSSALPWLFTNESLLYTTDGFARARFEFAGIPGASVIVWGAIFSYAKIVMDDNKGGLWLLSFVLFSIAIFISGQRSSWISLAFGIAIVGVILGSQLRLRFGTTVIIIMLLLPNSFYNRLTTIEEPIRNPDGVIDSSIRSRFNRWEWALNATLEQPFVGHGYGLWSIHNFFLEISSKAGVIPAALLLIFLIKLCFRIIQGLLNAISQSELYYYTILMAFVATWIVQLDVEIILTHRVLSVIYWILMAVGWYLPSLFLTNPITIRDHIERGDLSDWGTHPLEANG